MTRTSIKIVTFISAIFIVISAYGDDYQESMQCSAYLSRGGICRNGICVCAKGYYYIHGKCRAYSGLLEKCQEDGNCYVNGDFQASRCINNICNCSPGYYQRKYRTCRSDAKDEKSRFNETELFCWIKRGIGESCHQNVDCYIDGIDTKLFCDASKLCFCPTHATNNKTMKDITGTIRFKLCLYYYNELFVICSFLYVETKNHRAVINCTVFVNIDIIYNLIPDLRDISEVDNDCIKRIKNAKCTGMICIDNCIDNYCELNKQCVPGLNSSCISNASCVPKDSICKSNDFIYKEQYIAESVDTCVQALSYGKPCDKSIQCSAVTPHAVCLPHPTSNSSSVCACPKGYHYKFKKCFKRKVLAMNCENLGECYLNSGVGAFCRNSQSACDWNYIQRNDTICDFNKRHISFISQSSSSLELTNDSEKNICILQGVL
ncbi:prion-like-(Q/N-rich) domain-bearing protein 25 [Bombus flavifrons]|uniref:prion-like-(Q/N-rich) domain-bearing protein 25 n=1 Tax=Bombus flavifrons TaxID=103934 RepID=UPI003704AA37